MRRALLILLSLTASAPLFPQSNPSRTPQPIPRISCVARNQGYVLQHFNKDTGKLELQDEDDWRVRCTIVVGEKTVWDDDLILLHPCDLPTAVEAIEVFRKKRAVQILKGEHH